MQRSARKRQVMAYCAAVVGVHALEYKGVVVDEENVIGIDIAGIVFCML